MIDLSVLDKAPALDLEERIVHELEGKTQPVEDKKLRMIVEKEKVFCQAAVDFTKFCALPKPGEQYRIVTNKCWNGYTLIKRILATDVVIEELYLAVYSINDVAAKGLVKSYESGRIKKPGSSYQTYSGDIAIRKPIKRTGTSESSAKARPIFIMAIWITMPRLRA